MPDHTHTTEDPGALGLLEYYSAEVTNFHLSHGDGNRGTVSGRAAEAAQEAGPSAIGQAISAAGMGVGLFGEVMSLTHQMSEAAIIPIMAQFSFLQGLAVLPASSMLDPILGIDVHLVMIPPSPSPIPMPHPYIAMIMDPDDLASCVVMSVVAMAAPQPTGDADADAAASLAFAVATIALGMAGMGATVTMNYMPRTVAGTKNRAIPHFPMGASFAPVPILKNAGHAQFGSLFLTADGNPFTGMLHPNNDCWDTGMPQLNRMGYPTVPGYLYLPTGFVMAIPSTVIVNPIPTPLNPIAVLTSRLNAGFGRLMRAIVRNLQRLGRRLSPALQRARCFVTGHPVDVASGMLFTDEEDFSLPGVIPFAWERAWYSDSIYKGALGHGWHHEYDISFAVENNLGIYMTNDGREIEFELPEPGKFTFDRTAKLFLHCHKEENFYYITDKNGLVYRFTNNIYFNEYLKVNCQPLQSISNANGYAIRFEYNNKAQITQIKDSAGRILSFENDPEGRIAAISAPHPDERGKTFIIAQYEYDTEGDMICHTDALGQKMLYKYHNHLLIKETWRNGMRWYFEYDGDQPGAKCIHTWGDGNILNHKLTYQPGITTVENSLGNSTTYYIKEGLPYRKIDANGAEWGYRHNKYHELEWETDPLGNQQSYTHDNWGNIATETDAAGGFAHTEYYNVQFPTRPTKAIDKAGGKWKWEYDDRGNLIKHINSLGGKTKYSYGDGLLREVINPADAVTKFKYDKEQNLITIEMDDGATVEYSYDELGNCTRITNPNGVKQKRLYDLKSRIKRVNDFDGNLVDLEYDGIDNVILYRDKQKEVEYTYLGLWKLTSRTEGKTCMVFKYDTEEQLRKITNEHGLPYRFELDAAGKLIEEIGFDDLNCRYERNAAGWVTKVLRPAGKWTKYGYDSCGRVSEVLYNNEKKESYTYRPDGKLIQAVNESAIIQFERNVMGDILKETVNGEWIASDYDVFSNRLKITSSLGANISQRYNKMGNVLQMEANGWQANFEHDRLGFETSRLFSSGVSINWQRDGIGRAVIQTIRHRSGNNFSTQKKKQYQWDVNDRLKQIRDEKGITRFEHDVWSNLANTIYPNGEQQLRNPDAVGNLFTTADQKERGYAKGGQLKKANDWQYSYDAHGNLIEKKHASGATWLYDWNDAGMLTKVMRPSKDAVKFTYDALGRRLSKQYKNTVTKFIWDGNVPLHEWKEHAVTGEKLSDINIGSNGIVTWLFDIDSFAPAGKIKGDKQYSIVTDHLGTPSQMYKEDGALFWECELDSYGKLRMEKGETGSCPFRYQGQYEDVETGLYYNRFRYYAAEEGLYFSKDPIRLLGGTKQYSYTKDPNNILDYFGLTETYHGPKPSYDNPGHHQPGHPAFRGGGSERTSIIPRNAEQIYGYAVPDAAGLHWYARDADGNIHIFRNGNNGTAHWAGSSDQGRGVNPPREVRGRLGTSGQHRTAPAAVY